MMKKMLQLGFWLILLIGLFFTMGFVEKTGGTQPCDTIMVQIDYRDNNYFVSEGEVLKLMHQTDDSLMIQALKEINISLLEESLAKHPSVRNAEVYSTIKGELRISVIQKKPVARVLYSGGSYYIDEEGDKMRLSDKFTARVPLILGSLSDKDFEVLRSFLVFLSANDFWKSQVVSIKMEEEGLVIQPRLGVERIIVGDTIDLEEKFKKLEVFYKKVMPSKGLKYYSQIDLRFEDQVVGTK